MCNLSSPHPVPSSKDQSNYPVVRITYECVVKERVRESTSYLYEIACSITFPARSGYLSMRITGQNTYRNVSAREIPFTIHEAGATTYVELLEEEQLEVRVVDQDSGYS